MPFSTVIPNAVSLKSLKSGLVGLPLMAGLNHTLRHRRILTLKAFGCDDCRVRIRGDLFTGFSLVSGLPHGAGC
jgi:hypothetical protein